MIADQQCNRAAAQDAGLDRLDGGAGGVAQVAVEHRHFANGRAIAEAPQRATGWARPLPATPPRQPAESASASSSRRSMRLVTSTVPLSNSIIQSPASPSRISTWPGSARTSSIDSAQDVGLLRREVLQQRRMLDQVRVALC